jgi:hypothetical protein
MPTGPIDMDAANINMSEISDAFADYAAKIVPLEQTVTAARE